MLPSTLIESSSEIEPTVSFSEFGDFSPSKYEKPVALSDYKLIKRLGSGAQGDVWKAIDPSRKIVALKLIKVRAGKQQQIEKAEREVNMLKEVTERGCNPYIVCYLDSFYDGLEELFVIVMEFVEGQDLDDFMNPYRERGELEKLYRYLLAITKDIIEGLKYIHSKDIFHNDIKPGNIMITSELVPKLVDFGLACHTDICMSQNKEIRCCPGMSGTMFFVAPETLREGKRYQESDTFSLAASLYYLATGKFPYITQEPLTNERAAFAISSNQPHVPLNTSNDRLNYIVNRGLDKDYNTRITLDEIEQILSQ